MTATSGDDYVQTANARLAVFAIGCQEAGRRCGALSATRVRRTFTRSIVSTAHQDRAGGRREGRRRHTPAIPVRPGGAWAPATGTHEVDIFEQCIGRAHAAEFTARRQGVPVPVLWSLGVGSCHPFGWENTAWSWQPAGSGTLFAAIPPSRPLRTRSPAATVVLAPIGEETRASPGSLESQCVRSGYTPGLPRDPAE
jgi:hypothetical protein